MIYPFNILKTNREISPVFQDKLKGKPLIFNFSSKNPQALEYDTKDFDRFQAQIFSELEAAGASWGIGKYAEERKNLLIEFPQMIEEKRYYHAGLDIIVPGGWVLHAPLPGEVHRVGIDEGQGNYGGYVLLKHTVNSLTFYSMYGHLKPAVPEPVVRPKNNTPKRDYRGGIKLKQGDQIKQGEPFAVIGSYADSGGWFTHTHLQILTEKAVQENRILQGYVTREDLENIETIFPSPYFLFRY